MLGLGLLMPQLRGSLAGENSRPHSLVIELSRVPDWIEIAGRDRGVEGHCDISLAGESSDDLHLSIPAPGEVK